MEVWTIGSALRVCERLLTDGNDEHPRRSAQWLLAAVCACSRLEIYMQLDRPLTGDERDRLRALLRRRLHHEPLQYLLGTAAFRHLELKVGPGVLIPRPETEVLVDLAREALEALEAPDTRTAIRRQRRKAVPTNLQSQSGNAASDADTEANATTVKVQPGNAASDGMTYIADLCTGSGCVGLALAQECPNVQVWATDISCEAVALANENAHALGLNERFRAYHADLFQGVSPPPADQQAVLQGAAEIRETDLSGQAPDDPAPAHNRKYHLIVANPPYLPHADMDVLTPEIRDWEPALALDGGADGLDLARRILLASFDRLLDSGVVLMELDPRNVSAARNFALELDRYARVEERSDLTGRPRFLVAHR
ncbi:MAG: peptide chain release factor N(5)-glutamine methyltransferase [Actinomycetes bacterium]|jgi:release factor glutamine methyltransferase|nr:peptide chain release factor N(5)-glutamine methyltransferase [Actinomycetes bacterium]